VIVTSIFVYSKAIIEIYTYSQTPKAAIVKSCVRIRTWSSLRRGSDEYPDSEE